MCDFWPAITICSLVHDVETRLLFQSDHLLLFVGELQRSSGRLPVCWSVYVGVGWWLVVLLWGMGGVRTGLDNLHVIGREHSKMAVWTVASPPALIYHFDPGDDVIGIKRDLSVVS